MSDPDHRREPVSPEDGPPDPSRPPAPSRREADSSDGEERFLLISEKIMGTAMMFIGFLNVLLSISGGYEINVVPLLIYCGGLAIWAHASIANPTHRYVVMGAAIVLALAIAHYGEVLFWHKQVVFWGTVVLVVFFMFKSAPKPD